MRKSVTFKGGVHPPDGKSLSQNAAIQPLLPKGNAVYPLSQHIGAPAKAVVNVGDHVLVGSLLAEAGGFVSAPIYSGISGTVKSIALHRVQNGAMVNSIVIENDHLYESIPQKEACDPSTLEKEEILRRIKDAGVVGMGGAGFPTHVKLAPKNADEITHLLINGAECEPYITCDYRQMLENPEKIISGVRICLQLFKNAKGYICIEDNKMDAIEKLTKLCTNEDKIEVIPLKTKYPQGGERFLISAVTKKEINSSSLPADAGCVVDNICTMMAIHDAVVYEKPLTHRVVTVSGDAITTPSNFYVPLGIYVQELLEAAGGYDEELEKLISGGPMMGVAMFDTNTPIVKTSGGITALSVDEVAKAQEMNCINCGRCVSACPEKLIPSHLATYAQRRNKEAFEKWYGMECIECGCCSYICPSHRHLTQSIRYMRQEILLDRKKQAAMKGGK